MIDGDEESDEDENEEPELDKQMEILEKKIQINLMNRYGEVMKKKIKKNQTYVKNISMPCFHFQVPKVTAKVVETEKIVTTSFCIH